MEPARLRSRLASNVRLGAVVMLGLLTPLATQAAPINYGDFVGNHVIYRSVTEDSNTGDTPPLFGAPAVVGDSLDFSPVGFSASAAGAGSVDQTDGQLSFMIEALQGNSLQTLFIEESGDTALAGFGSDATATQVRTSVFIDVLAVDFAPVVNPINLSANLVFTPSSGDYFLGTDGGGGPFFDTIWTGNLFVDLTALLASKGVVGAATKIGVNLDNRLSASSEAGTSAVIAKKDLDTTGFGISVGAPEPSALALAGLLAATAVLRRRSSRRV